eukprot:TRINITY_DN6950_c0_g1_i2.p4 TRINITY_DN6950_c0_g1~~TRINITY_DN6950_c0_g1_i2.p4  ORF type:complete len:208 (-),score=55.73 TRINITY_DN6950_c0_g1_i2:252-875(-)
MKIHPETILETKFKLMKKLERISRQLIAERVLEVSTKVMAKKGRTKVCNTNTQEEIRHIMKECNNLVLHKIRVLGMKEETLIGVSRAPVSYTHLRAHETGRNLVCRLLLEKKKIIRSQFNEQSPSERGRRKKDNGSRSSSAKIKEKSLQLLKEIQDELKVTQDEKKNFQDQVNELKRQTRIAHVQNCLLYTSPSPRDRQKSRMPSSA